MLTENNPLLLFSFGMGCECHSRERMEGGKQSEPHFRTPLTLPSLSSWWTHPCRGRGRGGAARRRRPSRTTASASRTRSRAAKEEGGEDESIRQMVASQINIVDVEIWL